MLDSGARSHVVSLAFLQKVRTQQTRTRPDGTRRSGLTMEDLERDPGGLSAGIDQHPRRYYWHRFGILHLGASTPGTMDPETTSPGVTDWKAPTLTVAPLYDEADMLLGSNWFACNVLWVSYSQQRIFIGSAQSDALAKPDQRATSGQ